MPRSRSTAKQYGSATQAMVAAWYREHLWPGTTAAGAGAPGRDLLNVPVSVEIKGRANFDPLNWIRQARKRVRPEEDEFPPWVVMRCIGQGEATVGEFIVLQDLAGHTALVEELTELRARLASAQVLCARAPLCTEGINDSQEAQ